MNTKQTTQTTQTTGYIEHNTGWYEHFQKWARKMLAVGEIASFKHYNKSKRIYRNALKK